MHANLRQCIDLIGGLNDQRLLLIRLIFGWHGPSPSAIQGRDHWVWYRSLRGLTPKLGSFNDDQFDGLGFERYLGSNSALAELEYWY
jgi:hypothetical protein